MKKRKILCRAIAAMLIFNIAISAKCVDIVKANVIVNKTISQESKENMEVFFSPFDDPIQKVLQVLDEAKDEVVIAHYNIRLTPILDKLVELSKRGVKIKVVVDKDNAVKEWNTGDDYLENNGIELVRSKPEKTQQGTNYSIMHLKSVVIDQKTVMTGSFNWNATAAYCNDENMIVIRDTNVAKVYRDEILELFDKKPYGDKKDHYTPVAAIHFSPKEGLAGFIQKQIDEAKESVTVSMFSFTQKYIGNSLLNAAKRGVKVNVLMENKQCDFSTVDEALENQPNVSLYRVGNSLSQFSAMHNKYCVIDEKTVITGSANWTGAGTRYNDEDIIIINNSDIAQKYHQNFLDLLYIYKGMSTNFEGEDIREKAPILFHSKCSSTQPGDTVVVVGNTPELGEWNPKNGLVMSTSDDLYPDWFARTISKSGSHVEYKYVIIRANGNVEWESGLNRSIDIPATGRTSEISGTYGNTSDNWIPSQNNKTENNNSPED